MDDHERELADATAELTEALRSLREELTGPSKGPVGLPRPPRPSELLRFTEQYTIPATIALLEAGIRTLELLGAVLRAADGRPLDAVSRQHRSQLTTYGRDRLAETSRETLHRLDDALADLQAAARGDPTAPEIQRLLDEARDLRSEVDDRLADAIEGSSAERDESTDTLHSERDKQGDLEEDGTGIDVDEELASIKRSVDETSDDGDQPDDSNTA